MTALQHRLVREYLESLFQGSDELIRAARQLSRRAPEGSGARWPEGKTSVADRMARSVRALRLEDTVQQAAHAMADLGADALPVIDDGRPVGMLTDRGIALRLAREGLDPVRTAVGTVMTPGTTYCFEDEGFAAVAGRMAGRGVPRLPVLDRDLRLVGVLSLEGPGA
jgi:CBS domain-containing protein